jgi:hypothetical protein
MVLCCWKSNSSLRHFSGSSISEGLEKKVSRGKRDGEIC